MLTLVPSSGAAQLSISLLNDETEVGSIEFSFEGSASFSASRLRRVIALTKRGALHGLQDALASLPLIRDPRPHLFSPLGLQHDVARLRQFYRESGFPDVAIRYDVTLDEGRNLVRVVFVIAEGPPTTMASLTFEEPSGAPLETALAPELSGDWAAFYRAQSAAVGSRLGEEERLGFEVSVLDWLRDRGYPFAVASAETGAAPPDDGSPYARNLVVHVDPAHRAQIGSFTVDGAESLDDRVFVREFKVGPGDWYSASEIRDGRVRVLSLPAVASLLTDVVPDPAPASTVSILLRAREARKRRLSGAVGYTNIGGMAFLGQWDHFNFLGGARTFTAGATFETGWGAVFSETADRYASAALSLRQPFVFVPGVSLFLRPFAEYRDDYRDRSWEAGVDVTAAYQYSPLGAVSLRYRLSRRKILDYALGGSPDDPILPPDSDLDELSDQLAIGVFTLSATLGSLADLANADRGFILQPSLELTAPPGFPTNEYFKADVRGSAYQTLGGPFRVAASLRAGRMFPFGASLPQDDGGSGIVEFLQLRDVTLMAGGPVDSRAWGSRLLGPKLPNIRAADAGTGATYAADRYLPLGGLSRVSGTLDLLFPFPGLPAALSGFIFTDAARVWTPDARYEIPDPFDESGWFYSAGFGVGVETPVGPIRASLGYKLNPSPLDLRDAGDVLALLIEGRPVEEAPTKRSRRFQLHLTVGQIY